MEEVTLNLFVSHVFLVCRILRYISAAIKKRGYLPLLLVVFLTLQRSQLSFLGIVKGVKSFIKTPFLHLWSNPFFCWMGVGKHYPNRTSLLQEYFLYLSHRWMECSTPVSPVNHHPLPEMTSIDNSSAAKFLALFCIPALLLASGSFDVASSVIV